MNITNKSWLEKEATVFARLVSKAKNIAIAAHVNPDGDAVGSTIGMYEYLTAIGKNAEIFFPTSYPQTLQFAVTQKEDQHIHIFKENPDQCADNINSADLLICLDFNTFARTDSMEDTLREAKLPKILIDHHVNPEVEAFDLCISTTEISSASELAYYLIKTLIDKNILSSDDSHIKTSDLNQLWGKDMGRALMTGMTTDTNNFSNSTFPSTMQMASELLEAGVDRDKIISNISFSYRTNRLRAMGYILDRKLVIKDNGIAYMILTKDELAKFQLNEGETEGFVNLPLAAKDVKLSIFLKEDEGKYRFSARSKEGVSAREFASKYFFGGGHEKAAGGKLPFSIARTEEEAIAYIEKCSEEFL